MAVPNEQRVPPFSIKWTRAAVSSRWVSSARSMISHFHDPWLLENGYGSGINTSHRLLLRTLGSALNPLGARNLDSLLAINTTHVELSCVCIREL